MPDVVMNRSLPIHLTVREPSHHDMMPTEIDGDCPDAAEVECHDSALEPPPSVMGEVESTNRRVDVPIGAGVR
jgi:hypothetical protein